MATSTLIRNNVRAAKGRWQEQLAPSAVQSLRAITREFELSVAGGDLLYLGTSWYVTHSGRMRLVRRDKCVGIDVQPVMRFSDPKSSRWAFKAIVYRSRTCRGFVGYGDADPSNVSPVVRGAEMRVAETRAVNRALRKAYGIGICSVEELGSFSGPPPPPASRNKQSENTARSKGNEHRRPLRDRLCLLIRRHDLDPRLVKAYAADYCDVAEVRGASREQVADFINHLDEYAKADRDGLLCQLNSYRPKPVNTAGPEVSTSSTSVAPKNGAGAA